MTSGPETSPEIIVLAETFRLLGDPTRLRIVLSCLDQPAAVGAIAEQLSLSQSLVSHHLRLLRAARLVRPQRHARQIFYSLSDDHVADMLRGMMDHIGEEPLNL